MIPRKHKGRERKACGTLVTRYGIDGFEGGEREEERDHAAALATHTLHYTTGVLDWPRPAGICTLEQTLESELESRSHEHAGVRPRSWR